MPAQDVVGARQQRVGRPNIAAPACLVPCPQEGRILGCRFAHRLSAERLLVAHLAIGGELAQGGGDGEGGHVVAPDAAHHQGRHQHVAPEVRGVRREPRHELLARGEQLDAAHLALHPARAHLGVGVTAPGGAHGVEKGEEVRGKDLAAGERGEGGPCCRELHLNTHPAPVHRAQHERIARCNATHASRIDDQRNTHGVAPVERRLHDPGTPEAGALVDRHGRA
ncbi:MAG: hypothetical protein IPF98_24530 [Gemmatimonadetes bacterium]|nr:hypothetical protein [Gemmatimonadota bacterium]